MALNHSYVLDLVASAVRSERLNAEDLRALMQADQHAAGGVIERQEVHAVQIPRRRFDDLLRLAAGARGRR